MFNRKNSNLLFLPMPKPIKDQTPDHTEIKTARNQSIEKQLRKIKQIIPPILTDRHYSSTQDLLEKVQEQVLYKTSILSRKSSTPTLLLQPKKTEQKQQQQQQLRNRRNEIDFVLKKLLNAQAIVNDEPQQMIEPRIYNPYFRSPLVLPQHLKDTYFDPDKYRQIIFLIYIKIFMINSLKIIQKLIIKLEQPQSITENKYHPNNKEYLTFLNQSNELFFFSFQSYIQTNILFKLFKLYTSMNIKKLPFKHILMLFYLASTYFILDNQYGYNQMITSLIIQFLLVWSHYQIVNTHPGPIKIIDTPIEIMQQKNCRLDIIIENEKQLNNKCKKCNYRWKPPKTHHCYTCNQCIHYRDHHCFWFNCCVGYKNLKYFCQFLMYFAIILIIHWISCLFWFYNKIQQFHYSGWINLQWSYVSTLLSIEFILKLFQLFMIYGGYQLISQLLKDKLVQLQQSYSIINFYYIINQNDQIQIKIYLLYQI